MKNSSSMKTYPKLKIMPTSGHEFPFLHCVHFSCKQFEHYHNILYQAYALWFLNILWHKHSLHSTFNCLFSVLNTFSFVLDPFALLLTLMPETSCVVFTSIFCPHLPSSTSIFHNPLPRLVWRGCQALFFFYIHNLSKTFSYTILKLSVSCIFVCNKRLTLIFTYIKVIHYIFIYFF